MSAPKSSPHSTFSATQQLTYSRPLPLFPSSIAFPPSGSLEFGNAGSGGPYSASGFLNPSR